MPRLTRRTALLALAGMAALPALPARAVPQRYVLDTKASRVGFTFVLNGIEQAGSMPVRSARIVVDPDNLANTEVDVSVNVRGARTGLIFATQALIGPYVLDAEQFPTIRFVSDTVQLAQDGRLSGGARIAGQLTLRGQTKPMVLQANLYRAQGTEPEDLSELQVRLSGQLSRTAYGASGYPALVRDTVGIDIIAILRAAE